MDEYGRLGKLRWCDNRNKKQPQSIEIKRLSMLNLFTCPQMCPYLVHA